MKNAPALTYPVTQQVVGEALDVTKIVIILKDIHGMINLVILWWYDNDLIIEVKDKAELFTDSMEN